MNNINPNGSSTQHTGSSDSTTTSDVQTTRINAYHNGNSSLPTPASASTDVVTLDYNDLIANVNLSSQIEAAFGISGLGVLTVKNVPNLPKHRAALLPLAREFAILPEQVKEKYVHEESFYSFGWSHGKEKLQGKPDYAKGSFYANPQFDRPIDDEELIAKHAPFIHPNIWPTPDLPELEPAFKNLGQLIVSVGELVAHQCDNFVRGRLSDYQDQKLSGIIKGSKCCKARLLHYFPCADNETVAGGGTGAVKASPDEDFSSWCGWHNDHGSLTGLTSAMFLDKDGNEVVNSDPSAGLYVRNRSGVVVKVNIPKDHIAFQIGETAQIHSGGIMQATPHAVRGSCVKGVSRETFAVFMEPMWMEPMTAPPSVSCEAVQTSSSAANLPPGVPLLSDRWNSSQDFGEFTTATLASYY
jgi:isopenicillin N synthase-like dioxygenase